MDPATATIIANLLAGIFSGIIEGARAAGLSDEEIEAAYQSSYAKVKAKDPASHPHPDFDSSNQGDDS